MKTITALLVSFFCLLSPASATPGEVAVGETLLNLPILGLTGESRMLGDYSNKPLIINVWASYCSPCLAEMGSLEKLQAHFGDQISLIGISIDDYPDRANAFLEKAQTTFPHYIDQKLQLENMLGANTIPLTIFVDSQGRILFKVRGSREWNEPEILDVIERMFKIEQ